MFGLWERALSILTLTLILALLLRFCLMGLTRKYRWFNFYLAISAGQYIGALPALLVQGHTPAYYMWFYFFSQPLVWLAYFLALIELYKLTFVGYEGLSTILRWGLGTILPLAFLIACLTATPSFLGVFAANERLVTLYGIGERTITVGLLLFSFILLALMLRYPIELTRNIRWLFIGYGIIVAQKATVLLLLTEFGFAKVSLIDTASEGVVCAVLLFWVVRLTTQGEHRNNTMRSGWQAGEKEAMRSQLASLNAAAFRALRKM